MLSRFAYELIATLVSLIPSRTRRTLSFSFITFFHQTLPTPRKMQNTTKKCHKNVNFFVFPVPVRLWADSNSTLTDSKLSSIDFTYSLDCREGNMKKNAFVWLLVARSKKNHESAIKGTS
jgi:hypothetical protein